MQPPEDASIGQAEREQVLLLGCWIESRLRDRTAGNDRDSSPGKSTPHLGRRDNGAVGEHTSSRSAPNLNLPLLLLGLVSSIRKWFLIWRILTEV